MTLPPALSPTAQRVQDALRAQGFAYQVFELSVPTRTAADAARAVNCEIGQIAKSLVFERVPGSMPVLVMASGANRVAEARLAKELAVASVRKPDAEYVRRFTGFAIGGVPPLGHDTLIDTLIDEDLLRHRVIWAAAGTPNALFQMDPADLARMTGGRVISIS
ncbi:MAG: YbaK/EbsC family protein [Anaerolineales bacterium]